jgi:hypothetical protein
MLACPKSIREMNKVTTTAASSKLQKSPLSLTLTKKLPSPIRLIERQQLQKQLAIVTMNSQPTNIHSSTGAVSYLPETSDTKTHEVSSDSSCTSSSSSSSSSEPTSSPRKERRERLRHIVAAGGGAVAGALSTLFLPSDSSPSRLPARTRAGMVFPVPGAPLSAVRYY